jgi:SAM-dependent methyltransferase
VQGELWGRAANDWASLQEVQHGPFFEAMLDAAGVEDVVRFFDAGCGGGGASVLAAGRGAVVTGLDAAAPLIEIASERVPGGDFRVGDLESLPFEDNAFDAVVASNSIQYAENRLAALQELARVATSDARIAVGLFGAPEKVDFRVILAAIREAMPEPPSGDGPFGLSGPGVLQGLVEDAGLNVTDSSEVNVPFVYPSTEVFWQAMMSGGPMQASADIVGEDALRTAVFGAIEPHITDSGGVRLEHNIFQYVTAIT